MRLTAEPRTTTGKKVKRLRKQGLIPAEFYGRGMENKHLAVKKDEFRHIFGEAGESTVIELAVGGKSMPALIANVTEDYLTGEALHVDFQGIRMDERITVRVPLTFAGEAPAVKEKSGVLNKTLAELEVEALPGNLPSEFAVDLSQLADVGQSIHVRDLAVPEGVKVHIDLDTVVASVAERVKEKEEEKPVEAVGVGEVKVEVEEKKEAREGTPTATEETKKQPS